MSKGKRVVVEYEDIAWLRVYHIPVDLRIPKLDIIGKTRGVTDNMTSKDRVYINFTGPDAYRTAHECVLAEVLANVMGVEANTITFKCIRFE